MNRIPEHVTIIMDGNGRWAKRRGLNRLEGHKAGVESVKAAVEFAAESRIRYLSLFAFSEENWNRPVQEVNGLMELMIEAIMREQKTLMDNSIRFRVIGDFERLSQRVVSRIRELESKTENNINLELIVFLSYSGRWDILQAAGRYSEAIAKNPSLADKELSGSLFESFLSTSGIPDPDLLIRTSGEQRISNYLLWQCAYTEFYFTEVLWPDFRKNDFSRALDTFFERERRYGKTGEQINKIK
jgi:undecaprenyl diphosphate synthase